MAQIWYRPLNPDTSDRPTNTLGIVTLTQICAPRIQQMSSAVTWVQAKTMPWQTAMHFVVSYEFLPCSEGRLAAVVEILSYVIVTVKTALHWLRCDRL